ncbi:phosphonate C-P lyase system protein PhnH [Paucidesulfovibrio longus]|uniref:phosphonate C-P lyase system protein PhnH n=1 Tax=Paucidesulfovibrio longus TaxID=889 RepID=UPI0003B4B14D|nr:phosphonate C-P lyase system protein PhnH [Paucidesulfovibrio longus]
MKIEPICKPQSAVWEPAVQQKAFRQLMNAFAFPGSLETLLPEVQERENNLLRLILATLTDGAVTVADPHHMIDDHDWSKLETNRETPEKARFIVARGDTAPIFSPALGSLECPEMGATVILNVTYIGRGEALVMRGPGIQSEKVIACSGLTPAWLNKRSEWNGAFPLGVDMILFDTARVIAIPRTTRIKIKEGQSWDM